MWQFGRPDRGDLTSLVIAYRQRILGGAASLDDADTSETARLRDADRESVCGVAGPHRERDWIDGRRGQREFVVDAEDVLGVDGA